MTTLKLKKSIGEKRNEAELLAEKKRAPKQAKQGTPQPLTSSPEPTSFLNEFAGKAVEIRISTGEILHGSFRNRKFDILITCTDGKKFYAHKNQIAWCRMLGEDEQ